MLRQRRRCLCAQLREAAAHRRIAVGFGMNTVIEPPLLCCCCQGWYGIYQVVFIMVFIRYLRFLKTIRPSNDLEHRENTLIECFLQKHSHILLLTDGWEEQDWFKRPYEAHPWMFMYQN